MESCLIIVNIMYDKLLPEFQRKKRHSVTRLERRFDWWFILNAVYIVTVWGSEWFCEAVFTMSQFEGLNGSARRCLQCHSLRVWMVLRGGVYNVTVWGFEWFCEVVFTMSQIEGLNGSARRCLLWQIDVKRCSHGENATATAISLCKLTGCMGFSVVAIASC